jgi:predicted HD phosphohydrolase
MREKYADSPYYDYTKRFCELYDGKAFDPEFKSRPIEFFVPMVQNLLARPRKTIFNGIKDL